MTFGKRGDLPTDTKLHVGKNHQHKLENHRCGIIGKGNIVETMPLFLSDKYKLIYDRSHEKSLTIGSSLTTEKDKENKMDLDMQKKLKGAAKV